MDLVKVGFSFLILRLLQQLNVIVEVGTSFWMFQLKHISVILVVILDYQLLLTVLSIAI